MPMNDSHSSDSHSCSLGEISDVDDLDAQHLFFGDHTDFFQARLFLKKKESDMMNRREQL